MRREFFNPSKISFDPIENEIKVISNLDSPYVVKAYEILENKNFTYIVMEYMKNGSLYSFLKKNKLSIEDIKRIFIDLIMGIEYLHFRANIIHFDIKLDNLLLDENLGLKVSDFGISKIIEDNDDIIKSNKFGSPFYIAPEMIIKDNSFHGKPIDIWACGIVLYYLVFGKLPFTVISSNELLVLYDLIKYKE